MEQNEYMRNEPVGGLIRRFAIPGVVSMVVNALYNIVDQIFIGHCIGYLGNAATNIILPLNVAALAVASMLGDGAAAFMSLNLGRRRSGIAAEGVRGTLVVAAVVGVAISGLVVGFLEPLCRICGATEMAIPYAVEYGRIIGAGLFAVVISTALNSVIRADGSPKFAMAAMICGAVINVVLDAVFMFGFGWGISGAAWATVISQIVTLMLSLWYVGSFRSIRIRWWNKGIKWNLVLNSSNLGLSSFVTQIAITVVIVVGNGLITRYGGVSEYGSDIPLAAYGITMKVGQIVTAVVVGIAVGCQPIIGYNYGAGDTGRVRSVFMTAVKICLTVTVGANVMFEVFPQQLVAVFGSESPLYNDFAVKSFRIFLGLTVLNGLQICSSIYFQAIGAPIKAAFISLSRQLLLLVPISFLLCRLMGLEGILWAGPVTDATAFFIALGFVVPEMRKLSAKMA